MLESAPAEDAASIRQGDVLEWIDPGAHRFGVIVTADCDIANEKFGEFLTYVPAIDLRTYLARNYLSSQVAKELTKIEAVIAQTMRALQVEGRPDLKRPLLDAAISPTSSKPKPATAAASTSGNSSSSATAPAGSGTSLSRNSRKRLRSWTSTTPANTCTNSPSTSRSSCPTPPLLRGSVRRGAGVGGSRRKAFARPVGERS